MKWRKTKYQMGVDTIADTKNLETHFAKMAQRGWMIEKLGRSVQRYRAAEPRKLKFFVDFLPNISMFDYPDGEEARDYRRMCEDSGWTFVTSHRQVNVFYCEDSDSAPIPIHTDNRMQARIYLKASLKYEILIFLLTLALTGIQMALLFNQRGGIFLSNFMIFAAIGLFILHLVLISTLVFIVQWVLRTWYAAIRDLPMPKVNYLLGRIRSRMSMLGIFIGIVCIIVGMAIDSAFDSPWSIARAFMIPTIALGIGLWHQWQINNRQRERSENIQRMVIIMVVIFIASLVFNNPGSMRFVSRDSEYIGDFPTIRLSDFGVSIPHSSYYFRNEGSILVPINSQFFDGNVAWDDWRGSSRITIRVRHSVNERISGWVFNHLVREQERFEALRFNPGEIAFLNEAEAAFWGADRGTQNLSVSYDSIGLLLLRDRTVLSVYIRLVGVHRADIETISQAINRLWYELDNYTTGQPSAPAAANPPGGGGSATIPPP